MAHTYNRFLDYNPSALRQGTAALMLSGLLGALLGAVTAKLMLLRNPSLQILADPGFSFGLRSMLLSCLFPFAILLADFWGKRFGFLAVFFCKGAAVSQLLCVCRALLSAQDYHTQLVTVLFRSVLPLPLLLFSASFLMQSFGMEQRRLRPILMLLMMAAQLVFPAIRALLYEIF